MRGVTSCFVAYFAGRRLVHSLFPVTMAPTKSPKRSITPGKARTRGSPRRQPLRVAIDPMLQPAQSASRRVSPSQSQMSVPSLCVYRGRPKTMKLGTALVKVSPSKVPHVPSACGLSPRKKRTPFAPLSANIPQTPLTKKVMKTTLACMKQNRLGYTEEIRKKFEEGVLGQNSQLGSSLPEDVSTTFVEHRNFFVEREQLSACTSPSSKVKSAHSPASGTQESKHGRHSGTRTPLSLLEDGVECDDTQLSVGGHTTSTSFDTPQNFYAISPETRVVLVAETPDGSSDTDASAATIDASAQYTHEERRATQSSHYLHDQALHKGKGIVTLMLDSDTPHRDCTGVANISPVTMSSLSTPISVHSSRHQVRRSSALSHTHQNQSVSGEMADSGILASTTGVVTPAQMLEASRDMTRADELWETCTDDVLGSTPKATAMQLTKSGQGTETFEETKSAHRLRSKTSPHFRVSAHKTKSKTPLRRKTVNQLLRMSSSILSNMQQKAAEMVESTTQDYKMRTQELEEEVEVSRRRIKELEATVSDQKSHYETLALELAAVQLAKAEAESAWTATKRLLEEEQSILKHKADDVTSQLRDAEKQFEEALGEHAETLSQLKADHACKLDQQKEEHSKVLLLSAREHANALLASEQEHGVAQQALLEQLEHLKAEHASQLEENQATAERERNQQAAKQAEEIEKQRDAHAQELMLLEAAHATKVNDVCSELTAVREAHTQELQQIQLEHIERISTMQRTLDELTNKLVAQEADIEAMVANHRQNREDLVLQHKKLLEQTEQAHVETLKKQSERYEVQLAQVQDRHAMELDGLVQANAVHHEQLVQEQERLRDETERTWNAKQRATLKEMETLQAICDELQEESKADRLAHARELSETRKHMQAQLEAERLEHKNTQEQLNFVEDEAVRLKALLQQTEESSESLTKELQEAVQARKEADHAWCAEVESAKAQCTVLEADIRVMQETHERALHDLAHMHQLRIDEIEAEHAAQLEDLQKSNDVAQQDMAYTCMQAQGTQAVMMTGGLKTLRHELDELRAAVIIQRQQYALEMESVAMAVRKHVNKQSQAHATELMQLEQEAAHVAQQRNTEVERLQSELKGLKQRWTELSASTTVSQQELLQQFQQAKALLEQVQQTLQDKDQKLLRQTRTIASLSQSSHKSNVEAKEYKREFEAKVKALAATEETLHNLGLHYISCLLLTLKKDALARGETICTDIDLQALNTMLLFKQKVPHREWAGIIANQLCPSSCSSSSTSRSQPPSRYRSRASSVRSGRTSLSSFSGGVTLKQGAMGNPPSHMTRPAALVEGTLAPATEEHYESGSAEQHLPTKRGGKSTVEQMSSSSAPVAASIVGYERIDSKTAAAIDEEERANTDDLETSLLPPKAGKQSKSLFSWW
eukprot:m.204987 g.204987  ORF g.204987 m.204987 type:complete len:1403 (+) comp15012_c0_seq9:293-4501(+)